MPDDVLEDVLDEAYVRSAVPEQIFLRGEAYCARGAVLSLARRGGRVHAEVEGSREAPYRVHAWARGDRVVAGCDGPYAEDRGEWCKHVVAVLLALVRHRLPVEEQPTVHELLAGRDRHAVERLVERLVEAEPWLYDAVRDWARAGGLRGP